MVSWCVFKFVGLHCVVEIQVCMFIYSRRSHGRTHGRTHGCTHARTSARAHERTHARTHTRTHARTHTRTHARTHARTHTRTHAHTHARTHARTNARKRERTHARTHARTLDMGGVSLQLGGLRSGDEGWDRGCKHECCDRGYNFIVRYKWWEVRGW
jgi:hypothetical protein